MTDIEKIDLLMTQTGADYSTVREALLACEGDVNRATDYIRGAQRQRETAQAEAKAEQRSGDKGDEKSTPIASDILDTIRDIWEKGNASSLIIEKDGKVLLRLSLLVSTIGLILAPVAAIIGLGAALITEYTIKIELVNGDIININELAIHRKRSRGQKQTSESGEKESDDK